MDQGALRAFETEPDTAGGRVSLVDSSRRAVKLVGDVLWWAFLAVVAVSIVIGVASDLLT